MRLGNTRTHRAVVKVLPRRKGILHSTESVGLRKLLGVVVIQGVILQGSIVYYVTISRQINVSVFQVPRRQPQRVIELDNVSLM